jgi:hypothetical protein
VGTNDAGRRLAKHPPKVIEGPALSHETGIVQAGPEYERLGKGLQKPLTDQ